jgi:predicted DNA-binding protein
MKRRTIHLSSTQHGRLAKRSQETGAPVAEIIRRAIDEYLTARRPRCGRRKEQA